MQVLSYEVQNLQPDEDYMKLAYKQDHERVRQETNKQTQRAAYIQGQPQAPGVERSFALMKKNRRLCSHCEQRLNASPQYVHGFLGTPTQKL